MIRIILITCLICCQNSSSFAQFFDDFSDSNLNADPVWEGDIQNFEVNDEEKLQLSAPDGGVSSIFTQMNLPDSIVWEFEAELDFSPSDNNRLHIDLALNDLDANTASGYFLEVGQNGADDDVKFYYLNSGAQELIASGSLGAMASEPAFVKARIQYFPDGMWKLEFGYEETGPFEDEIDLLHNEYDFSGNQVFQITCTYTSSRKDKYTFDNIGVSKFEIDKTGPEVLGVSIVNSSTLEIQCNESLDASSIEMLSNYKISPYSGSILSAELLNNESTIGLMLSEPLSKGIVYTININGVRDENMNLGNEANFELFIPEEALAGDLVVNEVLFNPETDGVDFVEIFNVSDKLISLANISILNAARSEEKPINADLILGPGKYLCLSEDISYLKSRYSTPDSAHFLEVDIPSFNNDEGNVSIVNSLRSEIIDAFDYSEDWHSKELDDVNGVSLERINPFGESQSKNNWFSASSLVTYATPGYQNSVFLNPEFKSDETLSFENKTFSPNQDGSDDQLVIKIRLPENGYFVDISIFDQVGRRVKSLVNNELFNNEGFVIWDGVNDRGEVEEIGVYFVVFEAFNSKGSVISAKKPIILADFLD